MTSQGHDGPDEPVRLTKPATGSDDPAAPQAPADFDPYRFGRPDTPVPPEYAPPGYTPPSPPAAPAPVAPPPGSYGPSPYGPPPGGYAGPPPGAPAPGNGYPQYGAYPGQNVRPNHGKAVASMVCGIVSIFLCWTTYLDALLVVPAFVLAVIVLSDKRSSSRGMAWAGLICAVVGTVLAVVVTVYATHLVHECSGLTGSELSSCIRSKI